MEDQYDITIVGNNVAALVTAHSLNSKYKICLINPTTNWGGHFSGKIINGERFDFGMNLLEFSSFAKQSNDLLSYNPSIKNDCGRFFHLVENYIKQLIEVNKVESLQMYYNGQYLNDFLIANNIDALLKLPVDLRNQIITELTAILCKKSILHSSNKTLNEELFIQNDYECVSIANHGETLHRIFLDPFCKKVLSIGANSIPAIFHRTAWSPLFYPETLHDLLKGESPKLLQTTFHYPRAGYFGIISEQLLGLVKNQRNVRIMTGSPEKVVKNNYFKVSFLKDEYIKSNQLIWAMDIGQLLKFVDIDSPPTFDKTSIAVVFLTINPENLCKQFSVLNIVDSRYSIYRITNQSFCSGEYAKANKLVIELNLEYFRSNNGDFDEKDLSKHTINTLLELKIIESSKDVNIIEVKILLSALNLPTRKNFELFQQTKQKIDRIDTGIHLVGQSSGYSSASLNDQIIQGLKLGVQFN